MTNVIARHGDMTIFKVSKEQVSGMETKELKKITLGLGEVTGHSHEDLVERENIFFEIKGTAVIMHEEHGPITLDEGIYLRTVQRQYNPFSKALERVRD